MNARIFALTFFYLAARLSHVFSIHPVKRILDGSKTDITLVPYVVSYMLKGKYKCCAAIINKDWVVTAAHCIKPAKNLDEISIRSGSSFLYKGVIHNVIEAVVHEQYDDITNDYDVGVMKVTPPFAFNNSTKPVNLAQDDTENIDTNCGIICGWGYYKKNDDVVKPALSKCLQCAQVPLIKKEQCIADYQQRYILTPRMTCYGFQEGVIDTCQGDSGGAIVNKNNILLGITSWGDGCGETYSPGVYTDGLVVNDWIKNKTKMDSS